MTTNSERPDRDEDVIDRMLAGEPAASDDEAATRAPYERLVKRLREFDDATLPEGWEERAALRLRAAKARETREARRRWMIGGAVVAAMAAAVLLIVSTREGARAETQVTVVIRSTDGVEERGAATIGKLLVARIKSRRAHVELRLYRGSAMIARCPGGPECNGFMLSHRLVAPGRYQVVTFESDAPLPEPQDGGLDVDVMVARERRVSVRLQEPMIVTP